MGVDVSRRRLRLSGDVRAWVRAPPTGASLYQHLEACFATQLVLSGGAVVHVLGVSDSGCALDVQEPLSTALIGVLAAPTAQPPLFCPTTFSTNRAPCDGSRLAGSCVQVPLRLADPALPPCSAAKDAAALDEARAPAVERGLGPIALRRLAAHPQLPAAVAIDAAARLLLITTGPRATAELD